MAIDGKTVRRSHDRTRSKSCHPHGQRVASSNWLGVGASQVEEKSNEITAIPKLLQLLELSGCIVTIDAMGCQKEIAREIVEAQADYLLAVRRIKASCTKMYETSPGGPRNSTSRASPMTLPAR